MHVQTAKGLVVLPDLVDGNRKSSEGFVPNWNCVSCEEVDAFSRRNICFEDDSLDVEFNYFGER